MKNFNAPLKTRPGAPPLKSASAQGDVSPSNSQKPRENSNIRFREYDVIS